MRFLSIIPEEDYAALAVLLSHVQSGTITVPNKIPKKTVKPEHQELRRISGHSIFDSLDYGYQEVIIQMMLSALEVHTSA